MLVILSVEYRRTMHDRSLCGNEVDQLLHSAEKFWFQIGVRSNSFQDSLPRPRYVGLFVVGPAERLADSVLPFDGPRDGGPGLDPQTGRLDGLPDIDVGMTDHGDKSAIRPACDGFSYSALLRAGDQVINENTDPSTWAWDEGGKHIFEVIDALQVLDNNTLPAEVGTPHLLDEFGVVAPLNKNSTGTSHSGPLLVAGNCAGRGPGKPGLCRARRPECNRDSLQKKSRPQRKNPTTAVAIF